MCFITCSLLCMGWCDADACGWFCVNGEGHKHKTQTNSDGSLVTVVQGGMLPVKDGSSTLLAEGGNNCLHWSLFKHLIVQQTSPSHDKSDASDRTAKNEPSMLFLHRERKRWKNLTFENGNLSGKSGNLSDRLHHIWYRPAYSKLSKFAFKHHQSSLSTDNDLVFTSNTASLPSSGHIQSP